MLNNPFLGNGIWAEKGIQRWSIVLASIFRIGTAPAPRMAIYRLGDTPK